MWFRGPLLVACVLLVPTSALTDAERQNAFIGYTEGYTPRPSQSQQKMRGGWEFASREHLAAEQLQNRTEPILLSKSPCVLLLPNFVDPKAAELMMRDSVGTLRSQEFRDQPGTRTSYGTMLWGKANRASETVEKAQSLVRAARSDGLEVKRYRIGEKYNSHHDYFSSPNQQLKDDRIATFLIYLQAAEDGGETIFPWAGGTEKIDPHTGWPYRPLDYNTECEPKSQPESAVKVAVPTGYAVLFYNTLPSGEVDPYSQHGSCPVKRGEKWTATVWTRGSNRFDPEDRWKTSELLQLCEP